MARYIDADELREPLSIIIENAEAKELYNIAFNYEHCLKMIEDTPTADVVPRAELDRSQYLLAQAWKRIEELETLCAQHNIGNIKFNTGDYARIVCNSSGHEFAIGTIVELEKYPDDYKAWANDEYWWVTDVDLEEIEEEQK